MDEPNPMWPFFQVDNKGPNQGITFRYEEEVVGSGFAKRTNEGESAKAGQLAPGYYKDLTVKNYTYALPITWYMLYHNKYPNQVANIARDAGEASGRSLHYDMANVWTFGNSASYTDRDGNTRDLTAGDGLSFFNAAHTLTGSSTTYSNLISGGPQFSAGSLEIAETQINQQTLDNNGVRRFHKMDTILYGSDATTENIIMKTLKSVSPRDEVNANVINPYQAKYRAVKELVLDTLATGLVDTTKSKRWALCDTTRPGVILCITENPHLVAPTPSNGGVQYLSRTETWFSSTTYAIVVLDPRCSILSTGTGS